jgi:hypothetical protein
MTKTHDTSSVNTLANTLLLATALQEQNTAASTNQTMQVC